MNLLITGGTGSFGQACVKRLFEKSPNVFKKIIIYSRDEQKQEQMFHAFKKDERLRMFLGDVRDKDRLKLALYEATHVIHAAALKIAPALEYNPFECLKTNVIGTQNLIDAIYDTSWSNSKKVILLSTDKACAPYNLYGASKACAEKLIINANNVNRGHIFNVVRYGNVANSRGSVIPLFVEKIFRDEKLPVTDEYMTRFWISLSDAVDFVLNRLGAQVGGDVFIPKMKSFRLIDLVECLCEHYRIKNYRDKIEHIGIRPGEKLHELLVSNDEQCLGWYNNRDDYFVITNRCPDAYHTRMMGEYSSANNIMSLDELAKNLHSIGG